MSHSSSPKNVINDPVIVQDIVVVGNRPPPPTGEYKKDKSDEKTQSDRIFRSIERLINETSEIHHKNNYKEGAIVLGKENNVTRLITNEFLFYTKTPLTLKEFTALQGRIATLASKQPVNLHLVLSSFAVKTPDNTIMNVVAHITCGKEPKINFILKNHPSSIDPVYYEEQNNMLTYLPNLNIEVQGIETVKKVNTTCKEEKLLINGDLISFEFNNVIECKTTGGAKFNSCIEICLDHAVGVAKHNFNNKWNNALKQKSEFPLQCLHSVSANCINLDPKNSLGVVTIADPRASPKMCKQGAPNSEQKTIAKLDFNSELNLIVTPPLACSKLSEEASFILKWGNIFNNFNVQKQYDLAKRKTTLKTFFPQFLGYQHSDRPVQLALLKESFLNATYKITALQKDIQKPTESVNIKKEKLLAIIQKLESAIVTINRDMKKAGHGRSTSRMGQVLNDVENKIKEMKADVERITTKKSTSSPI